LPHMPPQWEEKGGEGRTSLLHASPQTDGTWVGQSNADAGGIPVGYHPPNSGDKVARPQRVAFLKPLTRHDMLSLRCAWRGTIHCLHAAIEQKRRRLHTAHAARQHTGLEGDIRHASARNKIPHRSFGTHIPYCQALPQQPPSRDGRYAHLGGGLSSSSNRSLLLLCFLTRLPAARRNSTLPCALHTARARAAPHAPACACYLLTTFLFAGRAGRPPPPWCRITPRLRRDPPPTRSRWGA